jgi:hypothetical protein
MKKKTSFTVIAKRSNLNDLLREVSATAKTTRLAITPSIEKTLTLASLNFVIEGEELQIDAFKQTVQGSTLVYHP